MSCAYHQNRCAFPEQSEIRCEYCHCDWSKIVAPATRVTTRQTTARRNGEPMTVVETAYLPGYGELPLAHLWSHAMELARAARSAEQSANRKVAAA